MKHVYPSLYLIFPFLLLSAFLQPVSPACAGNELSMEEAVQTALENNPDIRMGALNTKSAKAALQKAESLFMPSISLSGGYTRADAPSTYLFKTIDQRQLPENVNFNDPGTLSNYEAGLNLRWNLYNGGKKFYSRKMAAADIAKERADFSKARDMVTASVIEIYFSILKAEKFVRIAQKSVETVRNQLRIMQAKYRAGGILKSDILSLEVRVAETEKSLVQSKNLYETAVTSFETVLAKEFTGRPNLNEDCKCPVTFPDKTEQAVESALEARPEITAAEKRIKKAQTALKAARAEYLPRVDLTARYYMDDDDISFNADDDNYMAALTMEWKLFSGFSTRADVKKAQYALKKAVQAEKKAALAIRSDVKNAYSDYKNARARFDVAEKSVVSADESFRIIKKRYEGGSEPVTRYLEAELAERRARINRAAAYYDMKLAGIRIGKAMGKLSQLWDKKGADHEI